MLLARGSTRIADAHMAWGVAFAHHLRISVVERRGLTLDTRFVSPSPETADPDPCLYVLLRGTWTAHGGPTFVAPAAFVVSEEQLEGGDGMHSVTYRTAPDDFAMIELHFRQADSSLRPSRWPTEVPLDAVTWAAAQQVGTLAAHDDVTLTRALSTLLERLVAQSYVSRVVAERATRPVSAPLGLLWRALRPLAERLELLPTVQQVGDSIGVGPREVDRHVRAFLSSSRLVGGAWRTASLRLRLKLAVIFLSAEAATVTEVARVVGYGSTDAMARAFRDSALPSPRAVQEALRAAT